VNVDSSSLVCSFCGKHCREVAKLIAGPGVFICNECAGLCNQIVAEHESSVRDQRIARRQDRDQDAVIELMDDPGLASLLEKQLEAHPDLDLTMRAAVRGAVATLRTKST
jgi:hypothetical protein